MELFGGMADMCGEGLPLLYLFVVTNPNAPPQTKETILVNWMSALKACRITLEFTLSDKDQLEINTLCKVWPTAKPQLCLWHVLQAIKHQLANNQEPPAFYDSVAMHERFDFIDPTFLPLGQMPSNNEVCLGTYNYMSGHAYLL